MLVFLLLTAYFVSQSGFLDNTRFDDDLNNPALNVNGDLEVYLPDGSQVAELIGKVEEDWSTNVMVVYIESTKGNNITNQRILQEISYVERLLNPQLSDDSDDVIYILSLSTVLKEVNSSAPRIRRPSSRRSANLGVQTTQTITARRVNLQRAERSLCTDGRTIRWSYEIPSQTTIDLVIGEMYTDEGQPSAGMNKLARTSKEEKTVVPTACLIVPSWPSPSRKTVPQRKSLQTLRKSSMPSQNLNERANLRTTANPMNPRAVHVGGLGLSMVLTGPVPITNAVTEFSFKLFWDIFPNAVVLVAIGLFIFHSDLLQAGITGMRPLQGFKVVVIAGLPTLCAVFWTLGLIGATNYEVTMTVIIVGPILLALGFLWPSHYQSVCGRGGSKDEKMRASLTSTGRACFFRRDDRHRFHLVGLHAHGAHPNRGHRPLSGYRHCVLPHHVHGAQPDPDFGFEETETSAPQGL